MFLKNAAALSALVDEVAPYDSPRACELLISFALAANEYSVERKAGMALSQMREPKSLKVIYQHLRRNPRFETRVVLCAVAFRVGTRPDNPDLKALGALIGALSDPRPQVVFAVLGWIRKSNDTRFVVPLIARLEKEERRPGGRLYSDLQKALAALTGESFDVAADWKNYWDARKSGSPAPRRSSTTKVVKRQFFSVVLDSDKIVFVIDISGSMERKDPPIRKPQEPQKESGGTVVRKPREPKKKVDPASLSEDRMRIYRVKRELVRTIESLPERVHFTILSFCHEAAFLDENQPGLVQASGGNKARAVAWIRSLAPQGETWTDTAFERVFKEVKEFDTIIFLSDGAPRRDNTPIPPEQVLNGVRVLNRFAKSRIHSIGFAQAGGNLRSFLQRLANENDGTLTLLE